MVEPDKDEDRSGEGLDTGPVIPEAHETLAEIVHIVRKALEREAFNVYDAPGGYLITDADHTFMFNIQEV